MKSAKEIWQKFNPPRELLLDKGAGTLSDRELLAIFLRTGIPGLNVMQLAQTLLDDFGSLYQLMKADYKTFCGKKGLGLSKFTQLQASIELSRRYFAANLVREHAIFDLNMVVTYLNQQISHREREIFITIFLDNKNRIIACEEMFLGTINYVVVHPREIVSAAIKYNAAAMILAHNHPSGVCAPSQEDFDITERISDACSLFDIRVLDHIVIGRAEYYSFAQMGKI